MSTPGEWEPIPPLSRRDSAGAYGLKESTRFIDAKLGDRKMRSSVLCARPLSWGSTATKFLGKKESRFVAVVGFARFEGMSTCNGETRRQSR